MVATLPFFTLLLSASLITAHSPPPSRRHRSLNNREVRAGSLNNAGRSVPQAPGTVQMRKRSNGSSCKIRASSNSSSVAAAASSTAAAQSEAASLYSAASSAAVKSASSAATTTKSQTSSQAAQADTATSSPSPVAQTTSSSSEAVIATTSVVKNLAKAATTAAATTTAASTSSSSSLTPNGKKAGIAGGDSYKWMASHLGWWYDWSAVPTGHEGVTDPLAVNMLWGAGTVDSSDASRLATFKAITSTPEYIIGFEEPDCTAGSGSAGMTEAVAAVLWNTLIAPWGAKGSVLLSPSMCKQADESWLTPFKALITRDWDVTNVHINKNSMAGVKKDLDYYYNKYGKPIWVTEFACVDDANSFTPCTDQSEINTFISDIVDLFESDSRVMAYAYSDGWGLGTVWPTVSNGALSDSGKAYLAAISKYH